MECFACCCSCQRKKYSVFGIHAAFGEDFFGRRSGTAACRAHGDTFALELREPIERLIGRIKQPKRAIVDGPQRQHVGPVFPIGSDHGGNLDAGFWVLQKLECFPYAGRLAQLQLNVGTRDRDIAGRNIPENRL